MGKVEEVQRHTKYEIARMIGSRALQIAMGAPFVINLKQEDLERVRYNPIEIAKLEYEKDALPITVKRPMPAMRRKKEEVAVRKE